MNPTRNRRLARGLGLAVIAPLALTTGFASGPAQAGPPGGDGTPGCGGGTGTVTVTPTTVKEGETITITGSGFAAGGGGAWQALSVKIDAAGPGGGVYKGTAVTSGVDVVKTFPLSNGGFSGTLVVPHDINDPAANPGNHAGPHYLRILGSDPVVSCWSNDFTTVDVPVATPQPPATDPNAAVDAKIKKVKAQLKKAKKAKQAAKVKKLKKKLKKLKQQRV